MPRNFGKGGKKRKKGKKLEDQTKRELVFKDVDQEYGQILKTLGGGRMEVYCFDGKKRTAHIRGKLMKRDWMNLVRFICLIFPRVRTLFRAILCWSVSEASKKIKLTL